MKKFLKIMFMFLVCGGLLLTKPVRASAANPVSLKAGNTYKSYDFTRNGKKDTFKYTLKQEGNLAVGRIYVNGKKVFSVSASRNVDCWFYQASKKKTYLIVETHYAGGGNVLTLYYFKKSKFVQVPGSVNCLHANNVSEARGDILYVTSTPKNELISLVDQGYTRFKRGFRVSDSGVKATSRYGDAIGKTVYYGLDNFYTSKTSSTLSVKNGPKITRGQKVTLKKIAYYSGYMAFMVQVNGKDGWFLNSSKQRITINEPQVCIRISTGSCGGKNLKLTASCNTPGTIVWSSSNSKVASVSAGTVTAKSPGVCVITASITKNGRKYCTSKTVTVKETVTYGNWSGWSFTPASNTYSQQVRTATMYRYYCFLCPVCGGREPFQGMSDCHRYSLTLNNGVVTWSTVAYHASNSAVYSYSAQKRYTFSLGDGKRWNFSAGNLWDTAPGTKDAAGPDAAVIKTGYSTRKINRSCYISSVK